MANMPTCEECQMRVNGDTAAAETFEAIRGQRLALAFLNGAGDAVGEIATELRGCHDCIGRLAGLYLGMYTSALVHMAGSTEEASKWIQGVLLEDLDADDDTAG